ncbi:hypothetical protein F2Q69_00021843 [Brassica cretica]|uniref:MADS-box domain-containing protein n=1 Tax=Brassica cretica TaxID=69181 RepID=A0A8S9QHL6_BRACR|nr:hypothetical protein F2Q69_00021843 [Brassica cretica]
MTRKKVKLAFIANDSSRKATYKKRKKGLMKKLNELSTLCGINACAIIYSPYDSNPEVWPSNSGVQRIISEFRTLPEMDQNKKMTNEACENKGGASSSGSALRNTQDETIRRSDIEALIKLLKDNSADSVESTHPDHEGGSRNVEQSTQAQPEENSIARDQDEMPSESDAETQVEAPSEENEAEPEQIQPLRRRDHGQEILDRRSWTENHGHEIMDRKLWTGKLKQGKVQRIAKASDNLKKQRKDILEMEMTEVMFQCLIGTMGMFNLNIVDLNDFGYFIDQYLKDVNRRIEILCNSRMELCESSNNVAAESSGTLAVVEATTAPAATIQQQQQFHQHVGLYEQPLNLNLNHSHEQQQQQWFMHMMNHPQKMSHAAEQMGFPFMNDNHHQQQ